MPPSNTLPLVWVKGVFAHFYDFFPNLLAWYLVPQEELLHSANAKSYPHNSKSMRRATNRENSVVFIPLILAVAALAIQGRVVRLQFESLPKCQKWVIFGNGLSSFVSPIPHGY